MVETMNRLGFPVMALMFGMTVTACSGGGSEPVPVDTRTPLERAEAKIAPDAVMLMDKADYSKTYAKLGADQFNRANDLTRWAAVAAAEATNCERVELIGLSDQSTRKELQWYVECANNVRVNIYQSHAEDRQKVYGSATEENPKGE